ncbi:hypothetical protein Pelo_6734 [Pelomyxa schiedti]|nr:hypothetical protein Pelo_6734 [Pelomyxa schiedti]
MLLSYALETALSAGGSDDEKQQTVTEPEPVRTFYFLMLGHKNDLPYSVSKSELADMLEMSNVRNKWMIQPASAITGMGFSEHPTQQNINTPFLTKSILIGVP